jgi:hypothetical protein
LEVILLNQHQFKIHKWKIFFLVLLILIFFFVFAFFKYTYTVFYVINKIFY